MNELTISTTNTPASFSFKNAKLNELSAKIAEQSAVMNKVYNTARDGAEAVNKSLAPLFGELLTTKCYMDDGFKSVQDYAEQTFSMSKSMAYMLARVGVQFYLTDNEYTRKARETLSTSKLAELCKVDRVAIAKAIDGGELAEDTSLADCRTFAATHKTSTDKVKVVPTFNLFSMVDKSLVAENIDKEAMYEAVAESFAANGYAESPAAVFFSAAKLDGDKPSAAQHFIAYTAGGFVRMYEYRPYIKPESKGKGKQPFDFAAYIKSLTPEQFAEVQRMMGEQAEQTEE